MAANAAPAEERVRLAEIIAALSLATDLAVGQPMEHALRRCLLAVELADALGLDEATRLTVFDLALMLSAGCHGDSYQIGVRFGDEQVLAREYAVTDFGRPTEAIGFVVRAMGRGDPLAGRARKVADGMIAGKKPWHDLLVVHCDVAQAIARHIGLSADLIDALDHVFERWDGKGIPGQAKGEAIPLPARIVAFAQDIEVFHHNHGIDAASAIARTRRGAAFDPAIVDRFCREPARFERVLAAEPAWEATMAAEPGAPRRLHGERLDDALRGLAAFADLKSPYTLGHSTGVAFLADGAAQACGLPSADAERLRRAALVHDLGRSAVPTTIWEKQGPLSVGEWERVRLHPYYTERILARPTALAPIGALAASHHERLDGSGYHRGASAPNLSAAARILAAADVYQALTEERPHRPARSVEIAAETLRTEAKQGRLDPEAVAAVLAAAGHRVKPVRREWPGGLSDREVEVLRLLARGLSSRRVADHLSISEKTVGHHIAHIYTKLDVSTRAAATVFAMQHELV